jgi:hypothetical protein
MYEMFVKVDDMLSAKMKRQLACDVVSARHTLT